MAGTLRAQYDIVIVGAGKAGVQTASSLRDEGFAGEILLVGDEASAPYDRPPLSKSFLSGQESLDAITLHGDGVFADIFDSFVQFFLPAASDDYLRAFLRKAFSGFQSHAAVTACNNCDFT